MIQFNLPKNKRIAMSDIDSLSLYVTENGGEFAIRKYCYEFYVPIKYAAFVAIKFPFLEAEKYVW
jgi:hypothetical protein